MSNWYNYLRIGCPKKPLTTPHVGRATPGPHPFEITPMTVDTAPRTTAPAAGLFGCGKPVPPAAAPVSAPGRGEPTSTQRKSFSGLFRAEGTELHAV